MPGFSLDHLSEIEFEQFCFDLLSEMDFVNLSWRKGTGLASSPADRGRDIQGQHIRMDVDGATALETWFFECKHYQKGVPAREIQSAIGWANAERPAKLVIIASNFLSNPAKDFVDDYMANNRPGFEIKIWERPDLERLSAGHIALRRKYEIGDRFPFLQIIHPAHLMYLRDLQINSLKYMFECFDACDPVQRDKFLNWVYLLVLRPSLEDMRTYSATRYESFKRKCHSIVSTGIIDQHMLTLYIISCALQTTFGYGDTTTIEEKMAKSRQSIRTIELAKDRLTEQGMTEMDMQPMITWLEEVTQELPDRIREGYATYVYFCEHVVQRLLEEQYLNKAVEAPQ